MRTLPLARLVLAAVLAGAPTAARAIAIVPVQDDRMIAVAYTSGSGSDDSAVPSPAFSAFDAFVGGIGIANASQTSSIGTTGMSGSGFTGVDGSGDGSGSSVFDVTFQVDEPVAYSFSGSMDIQLGSDGYVALLGPGGALYEPTLHPGLVDELADAGSLSPGLDYRLVVASSHPDQMGFQATGWSFGLDLTAVPEPDTGLLWILGLLVAAILVPPCPAARSSCSPTSTSSPTRSMRVSRWRSRSSPT